jgi:hypothetical protein
MVPEGRWRTRVCSRAGIRHRIAPQSPGQSGHQRNVPVQPLRDRSEATLPRRDAAPAEDLPVGEAHGQVVGLDDVQELPDQPATADPLPLVERCPQRGGGRLARVDGLRQDPELLRDVVGRQHEVERGVLPGESRWCRARLRACREVGRGSSDHPRRRPHGAVQVDRDLDRGVPRRLRQRRAPVECSRPVVEDGDPGTLLPRQRTVVLDVDAGHPGEQFAAPQQSSYVVGPRAEVGELTARHDAVLHPPEQVVQAVVIQTGALLHTSIVSGGAGSRHRSGAGCG